MRTRVEQGEMLCLPVDIYQQGTQLFKQTHVHSPPVDACHAAPFAANFAHQHDVIGIIHQFFTVEDFMHRFTYRTFELEHTFDKCRIGFGTDEGRVGFAADEHDHGIEDDGFARAGLTGEDDQARAKAQVEFVDDRKVLDVKFGKHGLSGKLDSGKTRIDQWHGYDKIDGLKDQPKDVSAQKLHEEHGQGSKNDASSDGHEQGAGATLTGNRPHRFSDDPTSSGRTGEDQQPAKETKSADQGNQKGRHP